MTTCIEDGFRITRNRLPRLSIALIAVALLLCRQAAAGDSSDYSDYKELFRYLIEANTAQVVMLHEQDLIDRDLAAALARALLEFPDTDIPAGTPSSYPNYLDLESELEAAVGSEASNIHIGRSRNDLGATMNLMLMRAQVLELVGALAGLRSDLLGMAAEHVDTVMPGYTHGVQAQPTTLAHFILAFDAGLERDGERLRQAYARINRSPLGSGAFTTSGFELDRERLAELLGFPALVENSYDAIVVNTMDTKLEFASALAISALNVGRFAQYLLFQYDEPAPGLLLTGSITGRSSIMPQKRNPSAIERLRLAASEVAGNAQTQALIAHNTPMYEVKDVRQDHLYRLNGTVANMLDTYHRLGEVLASLTVRPDLLRRKVDREYSTMTELADMLKREAGVPFRIGHEVASKLTSYGRSREKTLGEITRDEVDHIYREVTGEELPLSEEQVRQAFDAGFFVRSRAGIGGPQPASVERMLAAQRVDVQVLFDWAESERARLAAASGRLDRAATRLVH